MTVARGPEVSKVRCIAQLCGLRVTVESHTAPKGPLKCKRCQLFGHTQRNCSYAPRCVACSEAHLSGEWSTPKEQLRSCGCGGNHSANYRGCGKWKEVKAALAKRPPAGPVMKSGAPSGDVRAATTQPKPSAEQLSLGDSWNHVLRGGRCCQGPTRSPSKTHCLQRSLRPLRRLQRQAPVRRPGVRSLRQKCRQLPKRPAPNSAQPKPSSPNNWCLHPLLTRLHWRSLISSTPSLWMLWFLLSRNFAKTLPIVSRRL